MPPQIGDLLLGPPRPTSQAAKTPPSPTESIIEEAKARGPLADPEREQFELETLRDIGIAPTPGLLGHGLEFLSRPSNALFAAGRSLVKGEGNPLAEAGQALLGRRETATAHGLQEILPVQRDESEFGARSFARLGLAILTDPILYTKFLGLTRSGAARMAEAPWEFVGPGRTPLLEQVKLGRRTLLGFGAPPIPGVTGTLDRPTTAVVRTPQVIDTALAEVGTRALDRFGKLTAAARKTPFGKTAGDAFLNAFTRRGASPEIAAMRETLGDAFEPALRELFNHSTFWPAVEVGADTVAQHLTKAARGRRVWTAADVMREAGDYAENALRNPERFVDTPDVIKNYADLIPERFEDLLTREIAGDVDIQGLSVRPEALARFRSQVAREIQAVLDELPAGERGVRAVDPRLFAERILEPKGKKPELFEADLIEPKLIDPEFEQSSLRGPLRQAEVTVRQGAAGARELLLPGSKEVPRGTRTPARRGGPGEEVRASVEEGDISLTARRRRTTEERARIEAENIRMQEFARQENARNTAVASEINSKIAMRVEMELLEPRYIPNVATKYGREQFFRLNHDQMAMASRLGANHPALRSITGADRFARLRSFTRPDGTRLGFSDANRLARRGELPGYQGRVATEDIFSAHPLEYGMVRSFEGEVAIAEQRLARNLADQFGKAVDDLTAPSDYEAINVRNPILRNYRFPPEIAKEIRHYWEIFQPGSGLHRIVGQAMGEVMRLWTEWTILPFVSTVSRNFFGELYYSLLGGVSIEDFAHTMGAMTDVWRPFASAIERGASRENAFQRLRNISIQKLRINSEGRTNVGYTEAAISPDRSFMGFREEGGVRVPHLWRPVDVMREGFARGILGGGWTGRDLQSMVQSAFGRIKERGFIHKALNSWELSPVSRRFVGLKPFKTMQAWADDWPRAAHFNSLLRRGLTPREAAFEVKRYHVSQSLTPFEDRYLRKVIPFYRWLRFNLPKSLETVVRYPQLPYLVHKSYQYLTMGGPRLEQNDIPPWIEKMGGVPVGFKRTEDGRELVFYTGPGGVWPFYDIIQLLNKDQAGDFLLYAINPFLRAVADSDPVSDRDETFLGVRMSAANARFLRQTWRLGGILDQMVFPKNSLSEEEQAVQRALAVNRLLSPAPITSTVAGQSNAYERRSLAFDMLNEMDRLKRSIRAGRLNPEQEAQMKADVKETIRELRRQREELGRASGRAVQPLLPGGGGR